MTDYDCIAEIRDPEVFPATLRSYTVSSISNYPTADRLPALVLKGQWLEKAGFTPGRKLEVRVMNECIVLTARALEPSLEELLGRVQKLSKRRQQQVLDYIELVENKKKVAR